MTPFQDPFLLGERGAERHTCRFLYDQRQARCIEARWAPRIGPVEAE